MGDQEGKLLRIVKVETDGFEDYEVISKMPRTFLGFQLPWKKSVELRGVLEADDKSGLVVAQVLTSEGHQVYTNQTDDIYLDNSVKMLMLIPGMAAAFLQAGFRPKTVTTYEHDLRIVNRNPRLTIAPTDLPAVSEANG